MLARGGAEPLPFPTPTPAPAPRPRRAPPRSRLCLRPPRGRALAGGRVADWPLLRALPPSPCQGPSPSPRALPCVDSQTRWQQAPGPRTRPLPSRWGPGCPSVFRLESPPWPEATRFRVLRKEATPPRLRTSQEPPGCPRRRPAARGAPNRTVCGWRRSPPAGTRGKPTHTFPTARD